MQNKRGQLSIFIIIALVIVAIIIAVLLYPKLPSITGGEFSPTSYLQSCIEPSIKENLNILSKQGGYLNPEGTLTYQGEKIKYLCYTSEFYKTCVIQQPLLKEHVEQELGKAIKGTAENCMENLKKEYENRNYQVSSGKISSEVEISPGKIEVKFLNPLTITKESSRSFSGFNIEMKSEMYDLILTAISILDYESSYGDSETTLYIRYYPDLKIEKVKLSDGSKVYTLTNVVTEEEFRFASRSLSWPPGYGIE